MIDLTPDDVEAAKAAMKLMQRIVGSVHAPSPRPADEQAWIAYIRRRAVEGWRWGWEYNHQLKTDPLMWVTPESIAALSPGVATWATRYQGE